MACRFIFMRKVLLLHKKSVNLCFFSQFLCEKELKGLSALVVCEFLSIFVG